MIPPAHGFRAWSGCSAREAADGAPRDGDERLASRPAASRRQAGRRGRTAGRWRQFASDRPSRCPARSRSQTRSPSITGSPAATSSSLIDQSRRPSRPKARTPPPPSKTNAYPPTTTGRPTSGASSGQAPSGLRSRAGQGPRLLIGRDHDHGLARRRGIGNDRLIERHLRFGHQPRRRVLLQGQPAHAADVVGQDHGPGGRAAPEPATARGDHANRRGQGARPSTWR